MESVLLHHSLCHTTTFLQESRPDKPYIGSILCLVATTKGWTLPSSLLMFTDSTYWYSLNLQSNCQMLTQSLPDINKLT